MIRFIALLVSLVMLALLGLNVLLTIDIISRHPFEWLGAALFFYVFAALPFPGVYGEAWRRDRQVAP